MVLAKFAIAVKTGFHPLKLTEQSPNMKEV